jgi:hypothetical protein
MTQRLQPPRGTRRPRRHPHTPPVVTPVSEPTILGFPAEVVADDPDERAPEAGPATPDVALTVDRRPDAIAAGALVLAGVAANVSLLLSWSAADEPTGLTLLRRGGEALDTGLAEATRSGSWAPLVIVLCGGLLVVVGCAMLVPARAHRLLGVLALAVALAATGGALYVVADAGWRTERFGPGMWCAVAVAALGLLGALKAMLTAPRVTLTSTEPATTTSQA